MTQFCFSKFKFKTKNSEKGSALLLVMATSIGAMMLMWGASRVAANMNKSASGVKAQLSSIKASQEISMNGMAQAFTSGQKGTCAAGTVEMNVSVAEGRSVKLCLRGTRVGESFCIDNPNYPGDSSKAVCMQTVNGQSITGTAVTTTTSASGESVNTTTTAKRIELNWNTSGVTSTSSTSTSSTSTSSTSTSSTSTSSTSTSSTSTTQAPSCMDIDPCSCPIYQRPYYCDGGSEN